MRIPGCYVWGSVAFKEAIMIELKNEKTKQTIKVSTMVQAKPFIRAGYEVVKEDAEKKEASAGKEKTSAGK